MESPVTKKRPERGESARLRFLNERLNLIARVTGAVIGAEPLAEQARALVERVREAFQVDACVTRLLEGAELKLLATAGVKSSELREVIPCDAGISVPMIREKRPLAIEDVREHEATARLAAEKKRPPQLVFRSYAGAPMLVGDRTVGLLGLYMRRKKRRFTELDLEHLQIVANHIAVAIANEQLYEQVRELNEQLERRVRERTAAMEEANRKLRREVEERAAAEAQLRVVQSAIEQVHDAVMITEPQLDPPGPRIIYVNEAFTRMSGYTAEQIIGKTPRVLQGRRTRRDVLDALSRALRAGQPFEAEAINYRRDGSEYLVEWRIAPVRDAAGRLINWISIQRDVTERKRLEDLQRQHEAELAQVARLSTLGEMASGLAHELNQPLAAIANYATGSLRRLKRQADNPANLVPALEQIAAQADRSARIIQSLREFVGRREPRRSSFQLNELVHHALELAAFDLRRRGVEVRLELANDLPRLIGDTIQIEQIILNLIRNAVEAMEHTPIAERLLSINTAEADGPYQVLRVADVGEGIDPQRRDRVFDPFFTTKEDGMGVGLTISRTIAEAHGGRLTFEPNTPQGTVFVLHLPAPRSVHAQAARPA